LALQLCRDKQQQERLAKVFFQSPKLRNQVIKQTHQEKFSKRKEEIANILERMWIADNAGAPGELLGQRQGSQTLQKWQDTRRTK
jgi:hypothetical protein